MNLVTALKTPRLYSLILFVSIFISCSISDGVVKKNNEQIIVSSDQIAPFCNGLEYKEYVDLEQTQIDKLDIKIYQSKDFYEDLAKAYFVGNFINDEYKQTHLGEVRINYKNGVTCTFTSELRISGDWKDHVDINKLISSLDIKLLEGNILGITKFKLLIPVTRNGDNEIFLTTLLEEFNVITPRTFYIDVNLNGFGNHNYIFQEKASKELVERNGLREGPILETDETNVWNNSENKFVRNLEIADERQFMYAKYLNKPWVLRSSENIQLTEKALSLYNRAIYTSDSDPLFNFESDGFNNIQNYLYETLVLVTNGRHAQFTHNRKFYFNPFTEEFHPIYYDGMAYFIYEEPRYLEEYFINQNILKTLDFLINTDIDVKKFHNSLASKGYVQNLKFTENLIDKYYKNLELYSQLPLSEDGMDVNEKSSRKYFALPTNIEYSIEDIELNFLNTINKNKIFFSEKSVRYECLDILNCKKSELTLDDFMTENNKIVYFGDRDIFLNGSSPRVNYIYNVGNFSVSSNKKFEFKVNESNKTLDLKITKQNQEILLFSDMTIRDWKFTLEVDPELKINTQSYVTGCLTLYDLELVNVSIDVKNSNCEDALNIIKSNGSINSITIRDSLSDGLDIDFSTIDIKKLYVENSGNDCVDLSSGAYQITLINILNCEDKGVSIGEGSNFYIKSIEVANSFTGVAVKDSSFGVIEEIKSNNVNNCILIYRKKEEYGPSYLDVYSDKCSGKHEVQAGSIISVLKND